MEEPPQKKSRSTDPVELENDKIQNCEILLDSSPHLNYDILRIVFRYLKAKDLANAAKVSRIWLEAANKEKRTRGPEYTIRSFTRGLIQEYLEPAWIEPSVGLYFITGLFDDEFVKNVQEGTVRLPRNYDSIILRISGIIVDDIEMESCSYSHNQILSAYLPRIPNVQISTLIIPYGTLIVHQKERLTTRMTTLLNCIDKPSKQSDENSLCLMLFCDLDSREKAFTIISILKASCRNKRVSVWGGVVNRLHVKQANKSFPSISLNRQITVVAISGRMQSWSVVVDVKYKTKQQVEEKLKVFKDQVRLKKHSMGFMFACRARGQNMYNEERNVESTIFKRLFPKVPLVGCFGDGEFGTDSISVEQKKSKKNSTHSNCSSNKNWYNEFSTVFMILTYD
ncbi:F-box only protein 22-like [Pseudomyrmex gracilis]|uniref:F-box only protein 22-like n=1 Tax=Pseudomyrmex gracilis TaxID=219809 RepID=UPI0009956F5B|nr:F-box only protein 22-like [Pseudomyrmex gracilis]